MKKARKRSPSHDAGTVLKPSIVVEGASQSDVRVVSRRILDLTETQIGQLIANDFIDPDFYRRRYNLSISDERVIRHFLRNSSSDRRSYSAKMNVAAYLSDYPDVAQSGVSPIIHYVTAGVDGGFKITPHQQFSQTPDVMSLECTRDALEQLAAAGFLNPAYYRHKYNLSISNDEVLDHFVRRSRFDGRSYSENLDAICYIMSNPDMANAELSPAYSHFFDGATQARSTQRRWQNFSWVSPDIERKRHAPTTDETVSKIAIHLHIFYEDYLLRFFEILRNVKFEYDLLISTPHESIARGVGIFHSLPNVGQVICKLGQNRGRNFGPLLVDFRGEVSQYDLVLHMHSKKSLHSGEEQAGWAMYSQMFLAGDSTAVYNHIEILRTSDTAGVLGLVPFYRVPHWGSHSLKNDDAIAELSGKIGCPLPTGFQNYPLGGMFWFKPDMLKPLIAQPWTYEDFPEERGQTDGTLQHAIERSISAICQQAGGEVVYYEPWSNRYASNAYDTFAIYRAESRDSLLSSCAHFPVVSSDVFDTLIYRRSMDPDIGKRAVGARLVEMGRVSTVGAFIEIRNGSEFQIRRDNNFEGDVRIEEIYRRIATELSLDDGLGQQLCELEFSEDLRDQQPRLVIVSALNDVVQRLGKELIFVSDSYYNERQIEAVIRNAGVTVPFKLFVSSALQARKDSGSIWKHVLSILSRDPSDVLHIGDNVVSDVQIPGEQSFSTFYVMHPLQKFAAMLGSNSLPKDVQGGPARNYWLKIAEAAGTDPFFSRTID